MNVGETIQWCYRPGVDISSSINLYGESGPLCFVCVAFAPLPSINSTVYTASLTLLPLSLSFIQSASVLGK